MALSGICDHCNCHPDENYADSREDNNHNPKEITQDPAHDSQINEKESQNVREKKKNYKQSDKDRTAQKVASLPFLPSLPSPKMHEINLFVVNYANYDHTLALI